MADRRMIAKKVITTDEFYALHDKSKVLYIMCLMSADDDGFVSDVRGIMKHYNIRPAHLKALIDSNYIIKFQSGVILVRHWKVHNSIRADRYHETDYQTEKSMVYVDEKNRYCLIDGCHLVAKTPSQYSIGKVSSGEGEDVRRPLSAAEAYRALREDLDDDYEEDDDVDYLRETQLQSCYNINGEGVIYMTDLQYNDLLDRLGLEAFDLYMERLSNYIIKKDAHIKSHYDTILRWYLQDSAVRK